MSENTTLADEIIRIVHSEANDNPAPQYCEVIRIFTDDDLISVRLDNGDIVKYVQYIGYATLNAKAILCYLDGDKPFAIVDNAPIIQQLMED